MPLAHSGRVRRGPGLTPDVHVPHAERPRRAAPRSADRVVHRPAARRARLLDRVRAAFRRRDTDGAEAGRYREPQPLPGTPPSAADLGGSPPQPARWTAAHLADPRTPGADGLPAGQRDKLHHRADAGLRSPHRRPVGVAPSCPAGPRRGRGRPLFSDLASHNGTHVNGWLVREPVPVRPGDVLQFGSAMFVIMGPERAREMLPRVRARGHGEWAVPRERGSGGFWPQVES